MSGHSQVRKGTPLLALGAIGVVFGDIGTSPLYALRATLAFSGVETATHELVLGTLSLLIWALLLVIGVKYITVLLRADNGGEGGLFALLTLAHQSEGDVDHRRSRGVLLWVALIGAALLYGDGVITPAISVLSAMDGIQHGHGPNQPEWLVAASAAVVILIFLVQRFGSGRIGGLVGPLMLGWFVVIGVFGARSVMANPQVLQAFSPGWAMSMISTSPLMSFIMLGGVVLCLAGGEALYADMGHFGRRAIAIGWWFIVCPALLLSYLGQGAAVMANAEAASNPFFAVVPEGFAIPMVVIATATAIIASQAIISGAFSMTRQLIQQGLLPPMRLVHTSEVEGQIYLPAVNMLMAIFCILIVLLFRSPESLASAYGLAVTGVMLMTTILFLSVAAIRWRWRPVLLVVVGAPLLSFDLILLASNITKVPTGGWVPLLIACVVLVLVATWRRGTRLVNRGRLEDGLAVQSFVDRLKEEPGERLEGTGVFFTRDAGTTPATLRKLERHVPMLPQTIVMVQLHPLGVPRVPHQHRLRLEDLGAGVWQATVRYGYLQRADIPAAIRDAIERGLPADMTSTTYWVRRDQVSLATEHHGMARWRVALFAAMLRNAAMLPDQLDLPPRRTVEIGMRSPL